MSTPGARRRVRYHAPASTMLLALALATTPALAQTPNPRVPLTPTTCGLISNEQLDDWGFPAGSVDRSQADVALSRLYGGVTTDTLYTVETLTQLCEALGAPPARFTWDLRSTLATILDITTRYPEWATTLQGDDFKRWAGTQPRARVGGLVRGRAPVLPAAALLLPDYVRSDQAGAFLLTDASREALATAAEPLQYRVRPGTANLVLARFGESPLVERLRGLEAAPPFERLEDLTEAADAAFASTDSATTPDGGDPPPGLPLSMDSVSVPPPLLIEPNQSMDTETAIPTPLGLMAVQILGEEGPQLSATDVTGLSTLVDRWFPDRTSFEAAVRLATGIGRSRPLELSRIVEAARQRDRPLDFDETAGIQPLLWDGGGCGCGEFISPSDDDPHYFYGIFPFWAAPLPDPEADPEPQIIPFDQLTRIGYYGMTFDRAGDLQDSLHWREERFPPRALPFRGQNFADFSVESHNHISNVDLVVYQSDWLPWLPTDSTDAAFARARSDLGAALTEMRQQAVARISTPMSNWMDRLKPFIALGQSPRRTLGDGITLDFDFGGLKRSDQQMLFDFMVDSLQFFQELDAHLEEVDGSEEALLFDLDLDYHLNLVVPAYCLYEQGGVPESERCGFHTPENLLRIIDHIDLFLLDMSAEPTAPEYARFAQLVTAEAEAFAPAPAPDSGVVVPTERADSLITRGRAVRRGLDQRSVTEQHDLEAKLIPLVVPDPAASIKTFFEYTEPISSGGGTWLGSARQDAAVEALNAAFSFEPPDPESLDLPLAGRWIYEHVAVPADQLETGLCNIVCPSRWWLRIGIVLGLAALIGFWLVSEWNTALKQFYTKTQFFVFAVGYFLTSLATLWCDPWWSRQQRLILMSAAILGLFFYAMTRIRLRRERRYP